MLCICIMKLSRFAHRFANFSHALRISVLFGFEALRISASTPREQIALGKPAAGTVPTAPDSTRRPDLDLPAFRRFSMITVRAGQAASHGSCTELSAVLLRPQRSPPPGRQHSNFTRQRRRESPNQPARIPVCTRGSWPTTDGGELAMAASAVLDKV